MNRFDGQIKMPANARQMTKEEMMMSEGGNPGKIVNWLITGLSIACDSRWKKKKKRCFPSK